MAGLFDFEVSGLTMLQHDMKMAGEIPFDVLSDMLDAKAKVTEETLVYTAATMLDGEYSDGDIVRSIKRTKARKTKKEPVVYVRFTGKQHGNRNAEVAFINEYGKKSQPARPFIKTAIKGSEERAANAARKVLDEYLRKKNL